MAFLDSLEILDGERLSQTTRATVQSNGRLNFTPDTAEMMGITADSTLLLFAAGPKDMGAVVKPGDDRRGFKAKKSGPYYYISLKNYLEERGIEYKMTRLIFDITKLDENFEGLPIFKMVRRDIPHDPKVMDAPESLKNALSGAPAAKPVNDSITEEEAPVAPANA